MKSVILELYRVARSKEWKPWELQDELRKIYEGVVAVGDDLSFTIKIDGLRSANLEVLGARKCRIHPFKNAYRFEKGFIAFEDRFLRISRDLDEEVLLKILDLIIED